jgi:hypothetical protein
MNILKEHLTNSEVKNFIDKTEKVLVPGNYPRHSLNKKKQQKQIMFSLFKSCSV